MHRLPRRRTALLISTAAALLGALGAPLLAGSAASAQDAPPPTLGTVPTTAAPTTTSTTLPTPKAITAEPGTYGLPQWLPLRRDKPGTEVTVGCTYDSHGSQHGYECGGHHSRWALDFLADTGTPIYAAGPGFAKDFTGQPGGSGFGNVVRIDHGFGITTLYGHMSQSFIPPEGKWVDENTVLGLVGQTGSASAPHLHYEVFAGHDLGNEQSIDPGPLFACRGDLLVSFPQVAGFDSWKNLPWGSLTVASDGDRCVADDQAAPAKPAVPVPASTDDQAGDETTAATDAEAGTETPEPAGKAADPSPWTDLIGPIVEIVGSSADDLTHVS